METPLSGFAQALLFQTLDTGPGIKPRPPAGEATAADWTAELLGTIERRAQRILGRSNRKPSRNSDREAKVHAKLAIDLCSGVRAACALDSAPDAATFAIMAVSELWLAEYAEAVKENARKGAAAALRNKPILRIKEDVKWFWFDFFFRQKHRSRPTNARFVLEAQRRWRRELRSDRVVLRWCTEWKKEAKYLAGIVPKMPLSS